MTSFDDQIRRRDVLGQATEDYLKTIHLLAENLSPVSTSRIAKALDVSPASVTKMIQRLANLDLLTYRKHYGVTLNATGNVIALEILRLHRLLELYLTEALGFGWDEVHDEAEVLEHVISEKLGDRLAATLGNPKFDPHGEPIPSKEGVVFTIKSTPLTELEKGTRADVIKVTDSDNGELLRYLEGLGIVPGVRLDVVEIAPFQGPIIVRICGERVIVGQKAAASVYMMKVEVE